ncbi:MAG: DUF1828 domain-containing protein, partial [Calditrichaeota bacterium]|nr:DUF1828 domain-containing protein [Calditrichota bacterium]
MTIETIESDFKQKVCDEVALYPEGLERYRVLTPFQFDDGDHLDIVLKREADRFILSDEGQTYMHLTYDLDEKDLYKGTRAKIISNSLSAYSVTDRDGELLLPIENGGYGNALFSFIQALLKISDVS